MHSAILYLLDIEYDEMQFSFYIWVKYVFSP